MDPTTILAVIVFGGLFVYFTLVGKNPLEEILQLVIGFLALWVIGYFIWSAISG
jgi:EamA domain-containing membrane protein RarD